MRNTIMPDARPLKIIQGHALTEQQKKDLLNRLARVEGQIRGLQKLIAKAQDQDDIDTVAQQMSAARSALDRAFFHLLTHAAETHVARAKTPEEAIAITRHLTQFLGKFI
jgi:CsoR family transcriptional regulator, copper-sensing transcriptional repressor